MKVQDSLYVWIEGNEDKKERSALKSLQKRHIKRMDSSLHSNLFTCLLLKVPNISTKRERMATSAFKKREIKTMAGAFSCHIN
ncbi:hypothetical protein NCS13_1_1146 [Neochlamydia sp. S13]|nr:hypothetical protein NCS13_1_1146 [Neochlamydia sp. S13]